jgi:hypothetical protein
VAIKDGTLLIKEDGSFSYANTAFELGTAAPSFTYTLSDGTDENTGDVTITVTDVPENIPPVAENDSFSVNEGATISDNVISNTGGTDTDGGDGADLSVTQLNGNDLTFDPTDDNYASFTVIDGIFTAITPADVLTFNSTTDNGILRINVDGQFTYENKGFLEGSPAPTFEYTLSDGIDTDTARVSITVDTNAPSAVADTNYVAFKEFLGNVIAPQLLGNVVTGYKTVENPDGTGSTGDMADRPGVDGFGSPILTTIVYAGTSYSLSANPPGTPLEIETDYGTLVIDNMGVYTFKPAIIEIGDPSLSPDKLSANDTVDLEFTYTLQDGDILNSDTNLAILTIEVSAPFVEPMVPKSLSIDIDFNQTSGTIDTDFDAKALINVEDPASKYLPDLDDLSDILTDGHTGGLETYLAAMGEDESALVNIDLAVALRDFQVDDSVVLQKSDANSEHASFTTVTNGFLADGAIIISDTAEATNALIAELDSAELL